MLDQATLQADILPQSKTSKGVLWKITFATIGCFCAGYLASFSRPQNSELFGGIEFAPRSTIALTFMIAGLTFAYFTIVLAFLARLLKENK